MPIHSRARRFTVPFLVGVVAAVVASCSSGSGSVSGTAASSSGCASSTSGTASSGSSAFDQTVATANSEGSVTLYTPVQQPLVDAWTCGFEKAYPKIKLSVFRAGTGQVDAKLAAEQQAGTGGADVVVQGLDGPTSTTSTLAAYEAQGKLATLAGPNFRDKDMRAAMEGPDRFYAYATVFGWAWNTQLLPNGIHSWKDFLSPSLANGKVAVWDPSVAPTIPGFYALQVAGAGDPNYLKDLAAQKAVIYPSSEAMENAVASGEVAATMFASNRILTLKAQGAPVDFAVPPRGAPAAAIEAGVMKTAQHPAAAQVLANWLASVDGQKAVLVVGTPARSGVPGNDIDFAALKLAYTVTAAQQQAFVNQFNALFHQ
jgi:iron(III) transport system substrate-binding protein